MNPSEPAMVVVQALGWCLLHFVWQGVLVGVLYAVARMVLPRGNPRYLAAMAAMVLLAALPILTGWHEFRAFAQPVELGSVLVGGESGTAPAAAAAGQQEWAAVLRAALPWLVLAWVCGVAFLAGRVFRQWRRLRAIVRAAEALPAWQARAQRLGRRLRLRRAIRILASARIATPTLVGWVRPVVVVPLAMLARMPTEQVDLILAHELAHLRRLDHLANLFQIVVETLLFYHPVVHWISRDARNERELCCDALVLRATRGRRRDFVAALAGLADFRTRDADVALAASGGLLVERAWFIAGAMPERRHGHAGLAIGLALLGVAIALGVAWRQDVVRQRVEQVLSADHAEFLRNPGSLVGDFPALVPNGVPERRPDIAPVTFVAVAATPAAAGVAPRMTPAAVRPLSLSVRDISSAILQVAPAVAQPSTVATAAASAAMASRPIHTEQPAYPAQALLNGVQGRVEIQFSLGADGVPEDLQVVDASASGQLAAAALDALSRWRFTAPAVAGRQYRQSFNFRLDDRAGAEGAAVTQDCRLSTGTHICRRAFDTAPAARERRPTADRPPQDTSSVSR